MKKTGPYFFMKATSIPLYNGYFIVVFSNGPKQVAKVLRCKESEITYMYAHSFYNFCHKGYESFAVCFNLWGETEVTTGTIIHEVVHASNRVLLSRGVEPDFENDEASAYLAGWMGDIVVNFMKKCNLV
jgi:hypothetical protein